VIAHASPSDKLAPLRRLGDIAVRAIGADTMNKLERYAVTYAHGSAFVPQLETTGCRVEAAT
jgi:hypothetical protein